MTLNFIPQTQTLKKLSLLFALLASSNQLLAFPVPNHLTTEKAQNNDLRLLKVSYSAPVAENSAYAVAGELCTKNQRINATWGYEYSEQDLFKVSAEYLQQKLGYNFSLGSTHTEPRGQVALGAAYQRAYNSYSVSTFDFAATSSFAKGCQVDSLASGSFYRHLAGSAYYGLAAGATFIPYEGSSLQALATLDSIVIHRELSSARHSTGFGCSFAATQKVYENFALNLGADFKKPYNSYKAALNWLNITESLAVSLFGCRTQSKLNLPNTTAVGVEFSFTEKSASSSSATPEARVFSPALEKWMTTPAVEQPMVLISSEERFGSII